MTNHKTRKLRAILFADIVGYTALMQTDEARASQQIEKFRTALNEKVPAYQGQIINFYGDGCLCTFESAVDAMNCAKEVQGLFQRQPLVPVRMGLHSGDIYFEAESVYGDSVNIASRIESLGVAGAVLFSKRIKRHIANQAEFELRSLGEFEFKNVQKTMEVFALANAGFAIPKRAEMKGKVKSPARQKNYGWLALLAGLILAIAGGFYYFYPNNTPVPTVIDAITIFPFEIKSANPDIQYLEKGMVDLISTKLEGVPTLLPIDPNRVFNQLEKANEDVPTLEKATEISHTLGAAAFILGSIIEINEALQISASKYNSEGELIVKKTIEGLKTQLATLIDDLTRELIADQLEQQGQELTSIAVMTSDRLPALKAYLEGEQAYRKTAFRDARSYFQTAVDLDSTFALAWLRLYDSDAWIKLNADETYLEKALQYIDKLPPKYQDLLKAQEVFQTGLASNESFFKDLVRKYGENAEFTNLMAEHLFHYNPIHGRSISEAKPWLKKAKELDTENQEALLHLADIAYSEGDKATLEEIITELPPESFVLTKSKVYLLSLQDSVSDLQLRELLDASPQMSAAIFLPQRAVQEDPVRSLELGVRLTPYLENDRWNFALPMCLALFKGQEKELISQIRKSEQKVPPNEANKFNLLVNQASLIANRDFLPFREGYQEALQDLAVYDTPRAFFASAKYAWALRQEDQYEANKNKLAAASRQSQGIINPARYFHWSLAAFEARQDEDNEKALMYIDSAFQYTPASGFALSSDVVYDKAFMLADIYEEQQEYEKSIQRLENLPFWRNYPHTKGYATYRLSQLYEKTGEFNQALAKCNLFLKDYRDCDEKYRPWWNEVDERQRRLMSNIK